MLVMCVGLPSVGVQPKLFTFQQLSPREGLSRNWSIFKLGRYLSNSRTSTATKLKTCVCLLAPESMVSLRHDAVVPVRLLVGWTTEGKDKQTRRPGSVCSAHPIRTVINHFVINENKHISSSLVKKHINKNYWWWFSIFVEAEHIEPVLVLVRMVVMVVVCGDMLGREQSAGDGGISVRQRWQSGGFFGGL